VLLGQSFLYQVRLRSYSVDLYHDLWAILSGKDRFLDVLNIDVLADGVKDNRRAGLSRYNLSFPGSLAFQKESLIL
jgi:hypothetical protein